MWLLTQGLCNEGGRVTDQDLEFRDRLRLVENVIPFMPPNVRPRTLINMGGQGAVYSGVVNEKAAAIKVYYPGQLETRIEREVDALRKIQCPTIAQLLWADRVTMCGRDVNVVATSLVSGRPLDEVLLSVPLDEEAVAVLVHDVALAIEAMWAKRIVHRDIKPSNIVICPNGRACVIDLGVARHLDETSLTQMGSTWGTLGYMSPEQSRAVRQLTCKCDVYSLGVVAIEAGIGHHPTWRNQTMLLAMALHERLPSEVSEWAWEDLLRAMLRPSPAARPLPGLIVERLSQYVGEG